MESGKVAIKPRQEITTWMYQTSFVHTATSLRNLSLWLNSWLPRPRPYPKISAALLLFVLAPVEMAAILTASFGFHGGSFRSPGHFCQGTSRNKYNNSQSSNQSDTVRTFKTQFWWSRKKSGIRHFFNFAPNDFNGLRARIFRFRFFTNTSIFEQPFFQI